MKKIFTSLVMWYLVFFQTGHTHQIEFKNKAACIEARDSIVPKLAGHGSGTARFVTLTCVYSGAGS